MATNTKLYSKTHRGGDEELTLPVGGQAQVRVKRDEGVVPSGSAGGGGDVSPSNSGARRGDNEGESKKTAWYKREIGIEGEDMAIKALKKKGYKIIEKNYRSKFGEIDIVAEEKGYLVFIEVKRRTSGSFGGSFDAIDGRKKEHMVRSAQYYLKNHKCFNRKARFDVVGIDGDELKIIQHAFIVEEGARR